MFDPDKLYTTSDPDLLVIGPPPTLATWRHKGIGPTFIKAGTRVLYSGADLNQWLQDRKVRTSPEARAVA